MRYVLVGASHLAVALARQLLEQRQEVVIVEVEQQRIDELSDTLDCGFVAGDATRPEVLEEVGPDGDDVLICLSDSDPSNLVAAACGRRMGFGRAIVKLDDRALEPICHALELDEVLVPPEAVARDLIVMLGVAEESAG